MNRKDIQFTDKLIEKHMEKLNNVLYCYQYYDEKGRRLAIKGEKIDDKQVDITYITCSKKDSFCKRKAREAFETGVIDGEKVHPSKFKVGDATSTNWKKLFYETLREEFFKLEDYNGRVSCRIKRFNQNGNIIPISIKPNPEKLDLI